MALGRKNPHLQPQCVRVINVDGWVNSLLARLRLYPSGASLALQALALHAYPSFSCSPACAHKPNMHCFLLLMLALDHASVAGQQA